MSKFVKQLVTRDIAKKLQGVDDAVMVSTIGMDANTTNALRGELGKKDIHMLVVKNSLGRRARRALAWRRCSKAQRAKWLSAGVRPISWRSSKKIVKLDKDAGQFSKFKAEGGVLDGERLNPEQLKAVSKWPSREEQISILVGQILSPGAQLAGALLGPGGKLASQIKKKGEEE
jgi:large subunit ribosomal protein L10